MVLLVKIQESAIVENLKKRFFDDLIYVSSHAIETSTSLSASNGGASSHAKHMASLHLMVVHPHMQYKQALASLHPMVVHCSIKFRLVVTFTGSQKTLFFKKPQCVSHTVPCIVHVTTSLYMCTCPTNP